MDDSARWSTPTFLLSAALVLAGGYVEYYAESVPSLIGPVLGALLLYQGLLLAGFAYLFRGRGRSREPLCLLAILTGFVFDAPLMQHRFGWEAGEGTSVALIGATAGLVAASIVAGALQSTLANRLFALVLATVGFVHFAPMLLVGSTAPHHGLDPTLVAIGWLQALALVPVLILPRLAGHRGLPLAALETWGGGLALAALSLHFLIAGIGFDRPFHPAYLSPFVVLLAPALRRLDPERLAVGRRDTILRLLPYLGLALSAIKFTPALFVVSGSWFVTPFTAALFLTIAVVAADARRSGRASAWVPVWMLMGLAFLGGDMAEVMMRLRYPVGWQVVAIVAVTVWPAFRMRSLHAALWLLLLPAVVVAGAVAELGLPFNASLPAILAALAALRLGRTQLERPLGRFLAAAILVGPILSSVLRPWSTGVIVAAALASLFGFGLGRFVRDRAIVAAALAAMPIAHLVRFGSNLDLEAPRPGQLLLRLGFLVFALAFLGTLHGAGLRSLCRDGWRALAQEPPKP